MPAAPGLSRADLRIVHADARFSGRQRSSRAFGLRLGLPNNYGQGSSFVPTARNCPGLRWPLSVVGIWRTTGSDGANGGRVMPSGPTFVIVGASLAGARAAEALRTEGFEGQIVLIGHERHYPYERPPLSKGYLQGSEGRDSIFVHEEGWYTEHGVDLRLGSGVTAIDRELRQLTLSTGETVGYDKLLLTTGATPTLLPVPGAGANGVQYLRSVDDSERLRQTLSAVSRVVIVGAGWIGLEVAAAARNAGVAATVVSMEEQPLLAVLGPEVAPVFADLHREHGVDLRLGTEVDRILVSADAARGTGRGGGPGRGRRGADRRRPADVRPRHLRGRRCGPGLPSADRYPAP